MGLMFCDLPVSLNNPSSGDINSSNLPCFKTTFSTIICRNIIRVSTDWIQIRPDTLSSLILVETVCKVYQQMSKVVTSRHGITQGPVQCLQYATK